MKINRTANGHHTLNLIDENEAVESVVNSTFLATTDDILKQIKKIHRITAHKREIPMMRLLKHSVQFKDVENLKNLVHDVVESCRQCQRFGKTKSRPKTAMPKSQDFNERVSLDLAIIRKENKNILYCVDEFSRYIKGIVIANKNQDTIVKAIEKIWIHNGPGYPT